KGNEPPSGIVIEYLKLIEERTGITFKNEMTDQPFVEFIESMKQRQGPDMTAVIVPTPEREQYLSFSQTYITSPYVIFIREQDKPILDISGLTGKTLAVPRGFVVHERLVEDYPEIRLMLLDSDEAALQSVATGQSDAYIGNLTVASHIIHRRGFSGLQVAASGPFKDQSLSMGIRNDWPELTSIINKALESITEEEKTAIRKKYLAIKYQQGIDKAEVLKWVLMVAVVAFGVVLVFMFWNKQLSRKIKERTSELSESEARFRATFEQVAVGVAHLSLEGEFLRINKKFCDIVGYSEDEILNLTFQDITYPDDLETDLEFVGQVLQGHIENYTMENRYICKGGSIVWVSLTVSLVSDEDGNPEYFVSVIEDISERKRVEAKLTKSEEKYRGLVDNAVIGVFVSTPDGRFTFVNDAMAQMYDFNSPEQMMAEGSLKRWRNLKDRDRMITELQQHSKVTNFEAKTITHTDQPINVLFSAKQIGNGIFGMVMDISERKQAEKKIIDYQQRLKALASQLTITEENARRAIATDLHDNVSQALALARLQLASARKLASEPKLADKLGDISTTLFGALGEIQKLMLELSSPSMHELGISSAISEWLEEQIEKRYDLKSEVIDNISLNRLKDMDSNVRAILFRNIRELVVNVIKHARAKKIIVRLEDRGTDIRIIVEDDGIGFNPHAEPAWRKIGGFGLFSIEELMFDLGGNLKIVSIPGKGCTAILSVPFSVDDYKERD
ncbi:MAG: PAS domain S-box protein, partial [Desulfobacterales bacterium]|nr:PAS domain S-box protein [Desulfobacterales bacterium]